ncbi:HlyD family secretion protein [Phorcysia thermohydrogeniphila]|uniref:Multidrug resistance efflux pump n=1 Tax=Phorcysia thermohydrogeniphila TaxID=936138 RepID=A0A4R1GI44_9BACT|nr:HlyD family efflux transporter periplasmic adaptor subunit [Phorcysia thermohydrogeniphila]TCK06525.1 multidrug resistance efflux pump [Phorcysia thermohydrogeniphila]
MKLRNRRSYLNYVPEGEPPVSRKRTVAFYIYLIFVLSVAAYAIYLIYENFLYVEVSGYLEVPKSVVSCQKSGVVERLYVKEGQRVSRGELLALVSSSYEVKGSPFRTVSLEREIGERKLELERVLRALEALRSKSSVDLSVLIPELLEVERKIKLTEASLKEKRRELLQLEKLITYREKEERESRLLELSTINAEELLKEKAQLSSLKGEIDLLREELKALEEEKRRLIRAKERELSIRVNELKKEIDVLNSALRSLKVPLRTVKLKVEVRSPVSGKVIKVLSREGFPVSSGKPLMVIVPSGSRVYVTLFCSPKKAIYFSKGSEVKLILPDGREVTGKVLEKYSAALPYAEELTKEYWPVTSPVRIEVQVDALYGELWEKLDGIKVKARVRKL